MSPKIAWRNLWRNPKRTVVILVAVVVGLWSMIIMDAISRGMVESMLKNALSSLTGHIQIQSAEYREDPVVENRISSAGLEMLLEDALPTGALYTMRVQVGGVASNARNSSGVTIVGIDPETEPGISFYGHTFEQGEPLASDDVRGIIIGKALADTFDTEPGRKIVLMTQGADKDMASKAFRIRGLYRSEMEATEKRFVFITRESAQEMLGIGTDVTNVCIVLPDRAGVDPVAASIQTRLPDRIKSYTWADMLPLLSGYLGMYDSFMYLWFLVVFTAMAFGIVNTTLMAVLERTREFGLLKALGMRPWLIVRGVLMESFILLTMGLIIGDILGLLTTKMLAVNGMDLSFAAQGTEFFGMSRIIHPLIVTKDIVVANAVVLVFGLLVSAYPAIKAGRIAPVQAMAHT